MSADTQTPEQIQALFEAEKQKAAERRPSPVRDVLKGISETLSRFQSAINKQERYYCNTWGEYRNRTASIFHTLSLKTDVINVFAVTWQEKPFIDAVLSCRPPWTSYTFHLPLRVMEVDRGVQITLYPPGTENIDENSFALFALDVDPAVPGWQDAFLQQLVPVLAEIHEAGPAVAIYAEAPEVRSKNLYPKAIR